MPKEKIFLDPQCECIVAGALDYARMKSCEYTVTLHMRSLKSCARKNPKDLRQINGITGCGSECVGMARSLILQLIQGADFASQLCQSLHKFGVYS